MDLNVIYNFHKDNEYPFQTDEMYRLAGRVYITTDRYFCKLNKMVLMCTSHMATLPCIVLYS